MFASARAKARMDQTGKLELHVPPEGPTTTTFVTIYPVPGSDLTPTSLTDIGLPFKNIVEGTDEFTRSKHLVGELDHSVDGLWWDHFEHYKSGYCGTSVIAPFWGGITDPFLLHLIVLYSLSIVVRYLPSLWHEIEDGALNHVASLVEYYLSIVDNVVPQLVLERITGVRLRIATPGGLDAPI
jgi:hypothetical protein